MGTLETQEIGKTELLNAFFVSVFTTEAGPCESQTLEGRKKVWTKEDLPLFEENQVRDHLGRPDNHESMGPNGTHPQIHRPLRDTPMSAEQMLLLSHSLSSLKGHGELKRFGGLEKSQCHSSLQKARRRTQESTGQSASPSSWSGKVMEQLIMDVISRHVEEKIIKSSQHGFTRKSHA